ncbi:MAG: DUF6520 family protein [Algibacter sp.]
MKSKFFKIVLPAFAIMLALGLSSFTVNSDDAPEYFYDDPSVSGIQTTTAVDCDGVGNACTIQVGPNSYQLFEEEALATPLTKS